MKRLGIELLFESRYLLLVDEMLVACESISNMQIVEKARLMSVDLI